MAKFKIGDRVRIKWSVGWPELAGEQGTVLGFDSGFTVSGRNSDYRVAPDKWGSDVAPVICPMGGARFAPSGDQLEPLITPHSACEPAFKASLDELLARVGVDA